MTPLLTKIWFYYTLSTFSVSSWINYFDIKYPGVVLRQSILETGWYECSGCSLDYNNIFGFKTDEYIKFENWMESIYYYKEWQNKQCPIGLICSEEEYYNWLEYYKYARSDNYIKTLKEIKVWAN